MGCKWTVGLVRCDIEAGVAIIEVTVRKRLSRVKGLTKEMYLLAGLRARVALSLNGERSMGAPYE